MKALLADVIHWVLRNSITFLTIVLILVLATFVQKEVKELSAAMTDQATLSGGADEFRRYIDAKEKETTDRAKQFEKESVARLKSRIEAIERRIQETRATQKSPASQVLPLLTGGNVVGGFLDVLKADAEIKLLQQEKAYLEGLLSAAENVGRRGDAEQEMERRRQLHVAAYAVLMKNESEQAALIDCCSLSARLNPWSSDYVRLASLKAANVELRAANLAAYESYLRQRRVVAFLQKLKAPAPFSAAREQFADSLDALEQGRRAVDQRYGRNWLIKFSTPVFEVLPTAIGVLLAVIFVPVGIKAFFYFVIAPIASRRPAICILPLTSGVIESGTRELANAGERPQISAVAVSVSIDEHHELLVHPEYLQSSPVRGIKDTKWLLDWSFPMSSLVSGMVTLTRIRAGGPETVTVSATKDPFIEIGVLSLPEGSVVILQPHCLVGVVQRRDSPLGISSHWRLGSLNAWLTFQLRYLAFHGPAEMIVKGCRGVRIERGDSGRSINQAATIGFSANLSYSTSRCETFASYLLGKQELFNDNFSGGPGFYIYEEMPHFGKKAGITGRGLEGIADSLLKVLGV